jgi:hypothetical protein
MHAAEHFAFFSDATHAFLGWTHCPNKTICNQLLNRGRRKKREKERHREGGRERAEEEEREKKKARESYFYQNLNSTRCHWVNVKYYDTAFAALQMRSWSRRTGRYKRYDASITDQMFIKY